MKKSNLILMFVVLGVLMSSFVLGGPLADTWNEILDIGSLKFLFGASADNQLIGFVRIAIAVLIFSILYMGLTLKEFIPKNIAITIAAVLAIITAVFLPSSVLVAFGGTYSTIFALLIIGAPLVGVGWLLFKTPTEGRFWAGVKFLVCIFMLWLISEIGHWATEISGGTVAITLVGFAKLVDTFASWASYIVLIALVYFGIKIATGGKEPVEAGLETGKKIKDWGGKQLERRAKRQKTRLLREYVEEEKGLKDIDEVERSLDGVKEAIEDVYANKGLKSADEKKALVEKCGLVEEDINEAIREFRKIKKRTWRANIELDKVLKELKGKGVDVSGIEALENNILKLHEETKVILERVRDSYVRRTEQPIKNIDGIDHSEYPWNFSTMIKLNGKPIIKAEADKILAVIRSLKLAVGRARNKQEEAIKEVQGIITKTRDLWK